MLRALARSVKGILFADYVRMVRGNKRVDWSRHLGPEDLAHLGDTIAPERWYPMEVFERLGNAILHEIANDDLEAVRAWGRFQVDELWSANPTLVSEGDPVESLHRFHVLRSTYFDFEALDVRSLAEGSAEIIIDYGMGPTAEEAASHQTMGFFEQLLERSGAADVSASFAERSWAGDRRTLLVLSWHEGW